MSTHLFQALTLGLLLIVVVVLPVVVSMLGKLRAALDGRAAAHSDSTAPADEAGPQAMPFELEPSAAHDAFAVYEAEEGRDAREPVADAVEDVVPAESAVQSSPAEASPAESAGTSSVAAAEPDSERPFERAGRWYFRRSGELLVYEEATGEWVPAGSGSGRLEQASEASATDEAPRDDAAASLHREQVQSQAEEVVAASEPSAAEPATTERTPSTSFGGQPVAVVDEGAVLGATQDAGASDPEPFATNTGATNTGDFQVTEAQEEAALAHQTESFWKCPSCGAVNGSTAATCRMCFSARP